MRGRIVHSHFFRFLSIKAQIQHFPLYDIPDFDSHVAHATRQTDRLVILSYLHENLRSGLLFKLKVLFNLGDSEIISYFS